MKEIRIGVWNIDHPEVGTRSNRKQRRLEGILSYLDDVNCDIYVLSEGNSAIPLHGYRSYVSQESPFIRQSRFYGAPNCYHQVTVYCRSSIYSGPSEGSITQVSAPDPVNGVLCQLPESSPLSTLYGNVITIKDQWKKDSALKYTDRLNQQVCAIERLPATKTIVAGDFNLRLGWPQKMKAHNAIEQRLERKGWIWPTKTQDQTVQHLLHSPDVSLDIEDIDHCVKTSMGSVPCLSDHPFLLVRVRN